MIEDDVARFAHDPGLARGEEVITVIKGFDQEQIVRKIRDRNGDRSLGLTAADPPAARKYSRGLLAVTKLDGDEFDETAICRLACCEPFDISFHQDRIAYTAGSEVCIHETPSAAPASLKDPWLAFAHSVDFSSDGGRVLASSAGFDSVIEFDVQSRAVTWRWNAWDNGITQSRVGSHHVTKDQNLARALELEGHEVLLVHDPAAWPEEGIPTHMSPARLNGAAYDGDGSFLVSFYHRSELAVISRDGPARFFDVRLKHPHGFQPSAIAGHDGYTVTNSGDGEFLLLDRQMRTRRRVRFSSLPADPEKSASFGEWIQSVTVLDGARGILAAVDALRVGVHLVDIFCRTRRFLPYPPAWTLQSVIPMPRRGVT